jgi:hypothetical protein
VAVDLIAQATAKIEQRLAEVSVERQEIERALQRLNPAGPESSGTRRPSKRRRRRARPGQRRRQFIDAVTKQPGISVSQIAKAIGSAPNPLYGLANQLIKDGKVKKEGSGYWIASDSASKKTIRGKGSKKSKR